MPSTVILIIAVLIGWTIIYAGLSYIMPQYTAFKGP